MRCEWGPERLEVLAGRWERRKVPGVTPCGTQAVSGLWFLSGGCSPHPSGTRREAEEMELLQAISEAWPPCFSLLCSSGDSDLGVKPSS